MRKIKDVLRLKLDAQLSHERIAASLGISKGVVAKYVSAAVAAGLDWAQVQLLDETALQHRLVGVDDLLPGPRRGATGVARVRRRQECQSQDPGERPRPDFVPVPHGRPSGVVSRQYDAEPGPILQQIGRNPRPKSVAFTARKRLYTPAAISVSAAATASMSASVLNGPGLTRTRPSGKLP